MPGSWPKNGLFIVRAIDGKYWAETINPDFLTIEGRTEDKLIDYIWPAIQSLNDQIATARAKDILQVCKKVVHEKAKTN